jgi:putative alpha-1,2-mannosidase
MKKIIFVLLGLAAHNLFAQNYSQYVNPFIGTGGHGHTFPGAIVPFGMVQLSPIQELTEAGTDAAVIIIQTL